MEKRTREGYLDLLRIIAICAVVMVHAVNNILTGTSYYGTTAWYAVLAINPFLRAGVPLFLMISGYLSLSDSREYTVSGYYKRRLPKILLPFLLWDVVYFIVGSLTDDIPGVQVGRFFTELLNLGSSYHLWYVYTIAALILLTPFLRMITEKCTIKQLTWFLVLIIFCSTIRTFINTVTPLYLYWFDSLANGYMGYYLLGYILGKAELSGRVRAVIYSLGLFGLAWGIWLNMATSSHAEMGLEANMGFELNHFLIASAMFTLARHLPEIKNSVAAMILRRIAATAYVVYLAHPLVQSLILAPGTATPLEQVVIKFFPALLIPMGLTLVWHIVKEKISRK